MIIVLCPCIEATDFKFKSSSCASDSDLASAIANLQCNALCRRNLTPRLELAGHQTRLGLHLPNLLVPWAQQCHDWSNGEWCGFRRPEQC